MLSPSRARYFRRALAEGPDDGTSAEKGTDLRPDLWGTGFHAHHIPHGLENRADGRSPPTP